MGWALRVDGWPPAGVVLSPTTRFDDSWVFLGAPAGFAPFGSGCLDSVGVPELDAPAGPPWLGSGFSLRLRNVPGSSFAFFAGVAADATVLLPSTGGVASLALAIPNSSSLSGVSLAFQGLLDPGVNAAGAVVSNAGTALIAGR